MSLGTHPLAKLRVDQVGSLLRPDSLKQTFTDFGTGKIDRAAFDQAQEEAIEEVIAGQERIGFPILTDGEYRRINFQVSFSEVEGWDLWGPAWSTYLKNPSTIADGEKPHARGLDTVASDRSPATAKLSLAENFPLTEYRFAATHTQAPVKALLMGPDRMVQMCDVEGSAPFYADGDAFLADVVKIQNQMVGELIDAGCPYVQLDEPSYTGYVDETTVGRMKARGEDPTKNLARAIEASNGVIAGHAGKACFGLHVCRGNRSSMWHREGKYDPIAEMLFSTLEFDRLLLEYDTERAGGFEPLRFVRDDAVVVLGLVTTKTGELETVDDLLRRIEDASHFIDVDRLALSPQCGFASNIGGNLLTEDAQWAKLELVMETARRVWGD